MADDVKVPRAVRAFCAVAILAIGIDAVLAAIVYRENSSPRQLIRTARRTLGEAFAELESASGPPASEIDAFAARLRYAENVYRSAALGDVLGGDAVLGLAVTRCELGQIERGDASASCPRLLALAEEREPRNGSYQLRVADAWFRTGSPDRGSRIAAEAVRLNPLSTPRALRLLRTYGLSPAASVDVLGRRVEVLAAAREHFARSDDAETYLDLADGLLRECSSDLFEGYEQIALRLRQAGRIVERLESIAPCRQPETEGIRLRVLGHALLAAGRPDEAVSAASSARALRPGDARVTELRADCEVAAARHQVAVDVYREALREAARSSGSRGQRARLYRKIGQCYEASGDGGRAYDAYSKSLELNPDDVIGKARLRELTR